MIFEFRVFGLFLLFFLIIFYFVRDDKIKKNRNYSIILVMSYLLEFFYLICFIVNDFVFDKIYCCLFIFLSGFYIQYFLKLKNIDKEYGITLGIICAVICFFVKDSFRFLLLFLLFSSFIELNFLISSRKNIKIREFNILFCFILIEWVFCLLQLIFLKIEFVQSMNVLLVTYLYFGLENLDRKERDVLELENDYANRNLLDKGSFLRKLSHEVRIPVNSIDGFCQLIEEEKDISVIKDEVSDIRMASKELIDLINGMIDLSLIESGELKIINENYNVYDVLGDLVQLIPSRIKSDDIKFESFIDDKIPALLLGDSERIRQVILNIISNSIKYTEKGTISLNVSSVNSSSICRLIIKISDTGKGMDSKKIQSVLNGDEEDKGLGLKVSQYLLNLMNGNMEIDSSLDKGTCVTVTLDQPIVSFEDKSKKGKQKIEPISLEGKRVLLVDDNELNLKVASRLLLPYHIETITVTSGQECLDLLDKDKKFDLILMDDMMPNMSGKDTLEILRKLERVDGYFIPVVVLTANATLGEKDKYLSIGFDDYLAKPIEREELDRVIKKYLKK